MIWARYMGMAGDADKYDAMTDAELMPQQAARQERKQRRRQRMKKMGGALAQASEDATQMQAAADTAAAESRAMAGDMEARRTRLQTAAPGRAQDIIRRRRV